MPAPKISRSMRTSTFFLEEKDEHPDHLPWMLEIKQNYSIITPTINATKIMLDVFLITHNNSDLKVRIGAFTFLEYIDLNDKRPFLWPVGERRIYMRSVQLGAQFLYLLEKAFYGMKARTWMEFKERFHNNAIRSRQWSMKKPSRKKTWKSIRQKIII